MKTILKFSVFFFLSFVLTLISCEKEIPVSAIVTPPPPPQPLDPLKGREFIFSDLIWEYDRDGAGNLYIAVENRSDLFSSDRPVEVSLKPSGDTMWIAAKKFNYPHASDYVYTIYSNILYVFPSSDKFPWSGNPQLAGTKVSLKVKFL